MINHSRSAIATSALLLCLSAAPALAQQETYADVLPLLAARCGGCHRPDGIGPFSVFAYPDVARRLAQIRAAVTSRAMPPWKPEPAFGEFAAPRRLTDAELSRITRWIDAGGPPGITRGPLVVPEMRGALGTPDLVVTMPEPFVVPASGNDIFRNVVVPIRVPKRVYVKAWEFRVGAGNVVHHATIGLDATSSSRERDAADAQPGYEGVIPFTVENPPGYFLGWAPGQQQPQEALPRMAWALEPGRDVVMSMHLRPAGQSVALQASLALYFSEDAPEQEPLTLRLGRQDMDIPPGEAHYVSRSSYRLPVDVLAHTIFPHAHHLAREVKAFATAPDGQRRWLLNIAQWDFNWQDVYRFADPITLAAGTVITTEWVYDNSRPTHHGDGTAPRRVLFGPRSSDEMGDVWLQVVPRVPGQLKALTADFERHLLPQTIAGLEMMVRGDPGNAGLHDEVALVYQQSGQVGRAAEHYAASLRLNPASASAHNNVGSILLAQGRLAEARTYVERALSLKSDFAEAHYNNGLVNQLAGNIVAAIRDYRRALIIRPDYAEAHYGLAAAYNTSRETMAAAEHYRQAIAARPSWDVPVLELAWLLATAPDSDDAGHQEARALVERLVTGAGVPSAFALDVLAAAQARLGNFDVAIATAQRAVERAIAAGNAAVAASVRERLRLYRNGAPFLLR